MSEKLGRGDRKIIGKAASLGRRVAPAVRELMLIDRLEVYYSGVAIETAQPAKGGKRGGIEGSIHKRFPVTRGGWFTFRAVSQENYLAWATM